MVRALRTVASVRHMLARWLFVFVVIASLAACSSGPSLYDPVSIAELEDGRKPPGLAELGPHVADLDATYCYPEGSPSRCFYRASSIDGPSRSRWAPAVWVAFKPGDDKQPGFAQRPTQEGRFSSLDSLSYEDQKAVIDLQLRKGGKVIAIFQPNTGEAGVLGWGTITLPIFIGAALALVFLAYVAVRISRGGDRMGAPADFASLTRPVLTPLPPPPMPSTPAPASVRRYDSFPPGTPVFIRRANGIEVAATILEVSQGNYLCAIADGRRAWVVAEKVSLDS
jgi:hypothetical protein